MTAVSMKAQRKMQKATVGHVIGSVLKYAFLLLLAVVAIGSVRLDDLFVA